VTEGYTSAPCGAEVSEGNTAPVIELLGVELRRLFVIWNGGYRTLPVASIDIAEALHIAASVKHIRRASQYRRFEDVTDKALAGELEGHFDGVTVAQALVNCGLSGVVSQKPEGWYVGDKLVAPADP
jgi:hypothetical protein